MDKITRKAHCVKWYNVINECLLIESMKHQEETEWAFGDKLLPWSESLPKICKINQ